MACVCVRTTVCREAHHALDPRFSRKSRPRRTEVAAEAKPRRLLRGAEVDFDEVARRARGKGRDEAGPPARRAGGMPPR